MNIKVNKFARFEQVKTWYIKVCNVPGADAKNISGLLNPKKLGNFKNWML